MDGSSLYDGSLWRSCADRETAVSLLGLARVGRRGTSPGGKDRAPARHSARSAFLLARSLRSVRTRRRSRRPANDSSGALSDPGILSGGTRRSQWPRCSNGPDVLSGGTRRSPRPRPAPRPGRAPRGPPRALSAGHPMARPPARGTFRRDATRRPSPPTSGRRTRPERSWRAASVFVYWPYADDRTRLQGEPGLLGQDRRTGARRGQPGRGPAGRAVRTRNRHRPRPVSSRPRGEGRLRGRSRGDRRGRRRGPGLVKTPRLAPWQVWWVDFDPQVGREQAGRRPAIVVGSTLACSLPNRLAIV